MSIMMALGDYRFSIATSAYQQLQRTIAYRWQSQDRIGNDPAMQFVGTGAEQINLEGVIYPHFKGGLGQIEGMKSAADNGKPLLLVDGLGQVWRKWVITQIEETREVFLKDGVPRKITFRLSIVRYGED
ncbi:MAG: phage tail protein [Proteobacteria bacterium]|nr:phage tail protein [Pseudomonadota bacterium]